MNVPNGSLPPLQSSMDQAQMYHCPQVTQDQLRFDCLDDLISYPGQYQHYSNNIPVSPSSTDGSSSGYNGYMDEGNICAAADSSSGTPPSNKPKKYRSPETQVRQRRAANERERRRMLSINKAFDILRVRIPTLPYEKRLSKVDTLQLAIRYIELLNELLVKDDEMRAAAGELDANGTTGERSASKRNSGSYVPPVKKVVIECRNPQMGIEDVYGLASAICGHSLSWKGKQELGPNQLMSAKLWTPKHLSVGQTLNQDQFPSSSTQSQPTSSSDDLRFN